MTCMDGHRQDDMALQAGWRFDVDRTSLTCDVLKGDRFDTFTKFRGAGLPPPVSLLLIFLRKTEARVAYPVCPITPDHLTLLVVGSSVNPHYVLGIGTSVLAT